MGSFRYEAFTTTTTIGGGGDGMLRFVLQRWRQGDEGLMNGFAFGSGARGTGEGIRWRSKKRTRTRVVVYRRLSQ
ncbi:hypothetical protein BDN70DRAFT_382670 [Pholiota conissans]|uniref:Uncharacterized protein n=1 Tax=Pholiota conissans TaxID=109636 RepID=A0A9P6CTY2_9AGAR|nr:hypothetical protein BDN70DRAFT_382670 [Pholiota conissans]